MSAMAIVVESEAGDDQNKTGADFDLLFCIALVGGAGAVVSCLGNGNAILVCRRRSACHDSYTLFILPGLNEVQNAQAYSAQNE